MNVAPENSATCRLVGSEAKSGTFKYSQKMQLSNSEISRFDLFPSSQINSLAGPRLLGAQAVKERNAV